MPVFEKHIKAHLVEYHGWSNDDVRDHPIALKEAHRIEHRYITGENYKNPMPQTHTHPKEKK